MRLFKVVCAYFFLDLSVLLVTLYVREFDFEEHDYDNLFMNCNASMYFSQVSIWDGKKVLATEKSVGQVYWS